MQPLLSQMNDVIVPTAKPLDDPERDSHVGEGTYAST